MLGVAAKSVTRREDLADARRPGRDAGQAETLVIDVLLPPNERIRGNSAAVPCPSSAYSEVPFREALLALRKANENMTTWPLDASREPAYRPPRSALPSPMAAEIE